MRKITIIVTASFFSILGGVRAQVIPEQTAKEKALIEKCADMPIINMRDSWGKSCKVHFLDAVSLERNSLVDKNFDNRMTLAPAPLHWDGNWAGTQTQCDYYNGRIQKIQTTARTCGSAQYLALDALERVKNKEMYHIYTSSFWTYAEAKKYFDTLSLDEAKKYWKDKTFSQP